MKNFRNLHEQNKQCWLIQGKEFLHIQNIILLPVLESVNKVMFSYTYNIDNRSVEIKIKEEGKVIYISKFDILTTREFKKSLILTDRK
jgi:hypothetical protein